MKNSIKYIKTAFSLMIIILLSAFPIMNYHGENAGDNLTGSNLLNEVSSPEAVNNLEPGMKMVAENPYLILYLDSDTTQMAVENKASGKIWYSNPPEWQTDEFATANPERLLSQIRITYSDLNGNRSTMNNYTESIDKNQVEIENISSGVKITYTLGNPGRGLEDIPERMTNERFETLLLERVSKSTQAVLKRRFGFVREDNIWVRRQMIAQDVIDQVLEALDEAGYTQEDLLQDNFEHGIPASVSEKRVFVISLEYKLENENLLVTVPMDSIEYPENFPLLNMTLLEFFGAAHFNDEGYIFVPDGSGALFNIGLMTRQDLPYSSPVYGIDYAIHTKEKINKTVPTIMPVFGIVRNQDAMFGIIEDGEALATIQAYKGGTSNSYNVAFPSFDIEKTDNLILGSGVNSNMVGFQGRTYDGDISVRYAFLNGETADYNGMANYYRNYLIKKYDIQKIEPKENRPFILETLGSIDKNKTFMGIRYEGKEALTSFDNNIEILEMLKENGIDNIKLRVSGWFNGGMNQSIPLNVNIERVLGGKRGFQRLLDYTSENQIDIYPDVRFVTVDEKGLNIFRSKYLSKTIDSKSAKTYMYNPATYGIDRYYKQVYSRNILAAGKIPDIVDRFMGNIGRYPVSGISLADLGNEIYTDFNKRNTIDRQSAWKIMYEQVKNINQELGNIMLSSPPITITQFADTIVCVPSNHSQFNILEERVGFYQMVLHGLVDYASEPINHSSDHRKEFLRSIELGSRIYFSWIYQDASAIKGTDFDYLFSPNYKDWIDLAVWYYSESNAALNKLQDKFIVYHGKVSENVYKTVYEDNTKVLVNYNKEPVFAEGVEIDGYWFVVINGGD